MCVWIDDRFVCLCVFVCLNVWNISQAVCSEDENWQGLEERRERLYSRERGEGGSGGVGGGRASKEANPDGHRRAQKRSPAGRPGKGARAKSPSRAERETRNICWS